MEACRSFRIFSTTALDCGKVRSRASVCALPYRTEESTSIADRDAENASFVKAGGFMEVVPIGRQESSHAVRREFRRRTSREWRSQLRLRFRWLMIAAYSPCERERISAVHPAPSPDVPPAVADPSHALREIARAIRQQSIGPHLQHGPRAASSWIRAPR